MQRCLSTANRSISCKTSRQCSSLFFTKSHLYIDAGDGLRAGKVFRDWLALEQTVLHDGKADANRKGFDGRYVDPGECATWCLKASRSAQLSGERRPKSSSIGSVPASREYTPQWRRRRKHARTSSTPPGHI